ncbi:MAG: hypothetical protein ACRC14_07445 [Paracoccaceae bacterium]
MAKPGIIFHAGFHKTGTTSLQTALRLHEAALAPFYAVQTRATHPTLLGAAEAARTFSIDTSRLTALQDALTQWAKGLILQPGQGLFVSSEDFAGHMPGRHGSADYRAAIPIAQAIEAVLSRLHPHLPLSFLYTTREAEGWLRSIHWQLSKHHEMRQGSRRFARSHAAAADLAGLVGRLRGALPHTPVHEANLADLSARRLGPVDAMYDLAGLPDPLRAGLPVPPRANQAPPHDLARVFVTLNRSDLPRDEVQQTKQNMLAAGNLLLGESE